jgi:hypothetical protein
MDRGGLIVTVNRDFVDYDRNQVKRKGKRGTYFQRLIFLKPQQGHEPEEAPAECAGGNRMGEHQRA